MTNRAENRKFHYIYKITRTDGSGKYYIGMHSTDDLEDGYFGSGMLLWKSIDAHGKEKHVKEILEFLPTRRELKERERVLVNEEILNDPKCMNLRLGGDGWCSEEAAKVAVIGNKSHRRNHQQISIKRFSTMVLNRTTLFSGKTGQHTKSMLGKKHSEETKQKMRKPKNKGAANSQFGTCWVSKDSTAIKIKKEELDEYISNGYRRGRKH